MRLKFYVLNLVTMDRYDKVLDLIEHPEKYSSRQIEELLSDPDMREIYNLLCKTASASRRRSVDIDAEWVSFSTRHAGKQHRRGLMKYFGSRAAAVAAIALSSLAAVAVGIAVTVAVTGIDKDDTQAAVHENPVNSTCVPETAEESDAAVSAAKEPVTFEDAALAEIMSAVEREYGVTVKFRNPSTASLHLYYRFDPSLPVEEIIEQLNTFEQINIIREDNTLYID